MPQNNTRLVAIAPMSVGEPATIQATAAVTASPANIQP